MSKSSFKSILSGSIWGIVSKIIDALAKFVTIPMLVGYYGKGDYGLIALAFSLNAYLRLMDMGMNIGSVRFFSMWISQGEWDKIGKVSRSSILFYGVIGLVNALIFVLMAFYSGPFFKLSPDQLDVFRWMMYILAASTVLNWTSNVITQLLNAHGEMGWINRVLVISSIFNFLTAFIAVKLRLTLPIYFALYTFSTLIIIPFNIYRLNVYKVKRRLLLSPSWDGKAFKEILNYSMAIFVMGLFQFSADNLRPILLGKFASKGIEVLTEYRVIQTVAALVVAFGGVFMQVLLPSASKSYADNDKEKIDRLVYDGTRYISVFLSFIVFVLIVNSKTLLTLYMGESYADLSFSLSLWLLTILLAMHNAPVASLVLSTGKTKFLVYSTALSCICSLPVTILLADKMNVGAAVIGYFIYIFLQMIFYYFYYMPKVLFLSSKKLFTRSFLPAVLVGFLSWLVSFGLLRYITLENGFQLVLLASFIFSIVYVILTLVFVVKPLEIKDMSRKLKSV